MLAAPPPFSGKLPQPPQIDPPSNCSERGGPCLREREAGRADRHTARTVHNAFQGLKEKSANYCSKSREFFIKT